MPAKALKTRTIATRPLTPPQRLPSQEEVQAWIAEAAYYRAESRGFQPGAEADDWIAAEAEIMARVRGGQGLI
jgi:hypothetical protein